MKKQILFSVTLLAIFLMESCITSEYMATKKSALLDDSQIVGTWKIIPPKKQTPDELDFPVEKIVFEKGSSVGNYKFIFKLKKDEKDAANDQSDRVAQAFVSDLGGTKVISFVGEKNDSKDKDAFFYLKYRFENDKLLINLFFEKEVNEAKAKGKKYDLDKAKPTKFANEKIFQDFISKNIKNKIYWSEDLVFVKE
jgi:hypothetical protein